MTPMPPPRDAAKDTPSFDRTGPSLAGQNDARRYDEYAVRALAGDTLTRDEALDLLRAPDEDLRALLLAAFRVRERFFGRRV